MSKDYTEGIEQLTKLTDDLNLGQSSKLKERAAAIVRTFGDNEMKATFDRLTTFRARTEEQTRYEKTVNAIDLMVHEFKLKQNKAEPVKKPTTPFWTSNAALAIIIPIIFALIGGAYKLGFDNGSVKFDREKINLQKTIDSLRQEIKDMENRESDELKRLKMENKNVWDT